MPDFLLATLRRQKVRVVEAQLRRRDVWHDLNLVFPSTRFASKAGLAQEGSAVTHRFSTATARLELPHMKLHGLRHLYATLLLLKGVHPTIVQAQLGHANIHVTLDTYSHVIPQMGAEAARNIGLVFRDRGRGGRPRLAGG